MACNLGILVANKKEVFSKEGAHHALRKIARAGKRLRAYECPMCYKWHLTSNLDNKYGRSERMR